MQQDIEAIALEDAETSVSDNAVETTVVAEPEVVLLQLLAKVQVQ